MLEGAAQVRHSESLVDRDALDLVEHGGVRGVELVGAIDAAGRDDVDGQFAAEQRTDLHRAGVRAQHEVRFDRVDEECVLHGAGRVVLVEIHGVEVEPLVLDLRAFGDLPAHGDEQVAHLLHQKAERMPRPGTPARVGTAVTSTASAASWAVSSAARMTDSLGPRTPRSLLRGRLAHELARRGLLVTRQIADRGVEVRERRSLGGVRKQRAAFRAAESPRRFDVGECRRDGGLDRFLGDLGSVGHESQAY